MLKIRCRVEVRVVFRVRVSFFLSIQWSGGGGRWIFLSYACMRRHT